VRGSAKALIRWSEQELPKIIGIDLGTCGTAAAAIIGGRPVLIPNFEGTLIDGKAFPSVVAFTESGELLIGDAAKRQAVMNPEGTVVGIKRKMGTAHRVKAATRGRFFGDQQELSPEQISAFMLLKVKHDSEVFLGDTVDKAVITVPAYFNDNERTATKNAARIAGLEPLRIINESTASALAYGLHRSEKELKVMVFELGGGSFGVTIMEVARSDLQANPLFEVLATSGDNKLGGLDMDDAIIDYLADRFLEDPKGWRSQARKREALEGTTTLGRYVRELAEKAKIELSTMLETQIYLPAEWGDQGVSQTLMFSRPKLEELVAPILYRCRSPMERVLNDAKLAPREIDKIILVGGPTRMPIVRKFVEDYVGKRAEEGIDPMACAALGSAIQAGVIAGEVRDLLLLDVIPLSLGVETMGGVCTKLIDRGTTIPTRRSHVFSTAADSQTNVNIHVLQGERPLAADNASLGIFNLSGIPSAKRGVPQIEVTFDIDANGIMNVVAKDLATNKEQKIMITASTKLSNNEITKMKNQVHQLASTELKQHEENRMRKKEETWRNQLTTAETLKKVKYGSINKEQSEKLTTTIDEMKKALDQRDSDSATRYSDQLRRTIEEILSTTYIYTHTEPFGKQASKICSNQSCRSSLPMEAKFCDSCGRAQNQ